MATKKSAWAFTVLAATLVFRGDGCSEGGPGAVVKCESGEAVITLRPGHCAPIPNCLTSSPFVDHNYVLGLLDPAPPWASVRRTGEGLPDEVSVGQTPDAAFRVCATRKNGAVESPTGTFRVSVSGPDREGNLAAAEQTVRLTVREQITTVTITAEEQLRQLHVVSTSSTSGEVSTEARPGGAFRVKVESLRATVMSCAALQWSISPTDGRPSSASVTCDAADLTQARVVVDAAPDRSYRIVLVLREADGFEVMSNSISVVTKAEEPSYEWVEIVGPRKVTAYQDVMYTAKCWRGRWDAVSCDAEVTNWSWSLTPGDVRSGLQTVTVNMPAGTEAVLGQTITVNDGLREEEIRVRSF